MVARLFLFLTASAGAFLLTLVAAFVVFYLTERNQKNHHARGDVNAIATAANSFYAEYARFPATNQFIAGNAVLVDELTASKAAVLNERRRVFLETETSSGDDAAGDFLDPWGTPYRVFLDNGAEPDKLGYDGKVDCPFGSSFDSFVTRCVAISAGKNKIFGDDDDIMNVKSF